jgi:hypothetical protein
MGPSYVLQLLFSIKNHKIAKNSATIEDEGKNERTFGILIILEIV